jgi:uncharacterized protein YuzE
MMTIRFDEEADALYIAFREIEPGGSKNQQALDDFRIVDYDATDTPIGVEFLVVSGGINLDGVPYAEEISRALKALVPANA